MGVIPDEAKAMLDTYRLGYVATVSPGPAPNLSPKGTIFAYDDSTLAFAEIRSPQTLANIRLNPAVEINTVDPLSRRGYRFRGRARILDCGKEFEDMISRYRERGVKSRINFVVLVDVDEAEEVRSPLYDLGVTESEIKSTWKARFSAL